MRNDFFKYLLIHGRKKSVESETLPMTFKAKRTENLKNYRIYGNTVNGESVGDRTENLFDLNTWANTITSIRGNGTMSISDNTVSITSVDHQDAYTMPYTGTAVNVYKIVVKPNTTYRIQYNRSSTALCYIFENGTADYIYTTPGVINTHENTTFLTVRMGVKNTEPLGTTATISDIMISEGSTSLPYEPYGYKVPVTVNEQTTNIYLESPLAKSGNNADYIDFKTQKRYNSDGTEITVTLPEIAVTTGTNTLTVGTEIQPSKVYLRGYISRGDNNAE